MNFFYDLLFYLIFPLGIWALGRDMIGNYYAMLLAAVPGLGYAVVRFLITKEYNTTGIFIVSNILISALLSLAAGSAMNMLWYDMYLHIVLVLFWTGTIAAGRPMALYFFMDYAALKGFPRSKSYPLFTSDRFRKYFFAITGLFLLKDLSAIPVKLFLIQTYGVKGFGLIKTVTFVWNWIFNALLVLAIAVVIKKIKSYNAAHQAAI